MKLATFLHEGLPHVGVVDAASGTVLDLRKAARAAGADAPQFSSMLALIDGGEAALDAARSLQAAHAGNLDFAHRLDGVELMAPLPEPRQMRDATTFATHIVQGWAQRGYELAKARAAGGEAEAERVQSTPLPELPEIYRQLPVYYFSNRLSVGAPDSTVVWPRYSAVMDYELEFGIVTGRRGKDISVERAGEHIFGYTVFNDFSARDRQSLEMKGGLGPTKGKSFDGGNVLGPWIVTKDEIADAYSLRMEARINGRTVCQGTSAGMLFSFEEMLAYISQDETIAAGEFIGSGTVGNGSGLENGYFLSHGDEIELEVEGIGILRNRVVSGRAPTG
jgi:2-keto-4-pentenoate hydratase/2-oxohepta-3-ene-1,7-dioic acid hydratase in catechol pathway